VNNVFGIISLNKLMPSTIAGYICFPIGEARVEILLLVDSNVRLMPFSQAFKIVWALEFVSGMTKVNLFLLKQNRSCLFLKWIQLKL